MPISADDFGKILLTSYQAEVDIRKMKYNPSSEDSVKQASKMLLMDDSKFGLFILGKVGNGKTTLVKSLQTVLWVLKEMGIAKMNLVIKSARQITTLDDLSGIKDEAMLAIDDLGCEPTEVVSYGNVSNPVIELFEHRYDKRLYTIVTTNLKPDEIRAKYGDRVADRMNEMFHKLIFKQETSFRK